MFINSSLAKSDGTEDERQLLSIAGLALAVFLFNHLHSKRDREAAQWEQWNAKRLLPASESAEAPEA
jgi:hypothetical protein